LLLNELVYPAKAVKSIIVSYLNVIAQNITNRQPRYWYREILRL